MNTQARPTGADLPAWPALPLDAWRDTYATLHMWTQIVGKLRTTLSLPVTHWWHRTLCMTARGLTTSPIPYGTRTFEVSFDLVDPTGDPEGVPLPVSVHEVVAHPVLVTVCSKASPFAVRP